MSAKPAQPSSPQLALLPEFVDDRELAARLKISVRTPAQWRFTGKFPELPFYRFGRAVRYRREDVDAFIAKMRVGSIDLAEAE